MKKHFYFLLFCVLAFCQNVVAQNVFMPDLNFQARLIALGIDTNQNGSIQQSETVGITRLDLFGASITDLTGLEAFTDLTSLNCGWNQITALDVSALTNLEYLTCDSTQVSSLDASFCPNLKTLRFSYNLSNSLNVNGLTLLDTLLCDNNNFSSLDVSSLVKLKQLDCSRNQLSALNVSNLANLKKIICDFNAIADLTLVGNNNLDSLSCSKNQLSNLSLSACPNLRSFVCFSNQFTSLNLAVCPNLRQLQCGANLLTALNVSSCPNLVELGCHYNQISSLNLANCPNLTVLYFQHNAISSINLTNNANLIMLDASYNQLSAINVSNMANLTIFRCPNNQITSLNVNGLQNLNELECSNNAFINLDVSNLPNLQYFTCDNTNIPLLNFSNSPTLLRVSCAGSPQLQALFLKNGSNENVLYFPSCTNLQYICADTAQIAFIQQKAALYNLPNILINDLCSFTLAGITHSVSGTTIFDANANGCTLTDAPYPFLTVNITNGTNSYSAFSNAAGVYNVALSAGNYTFSPQIQNLNYFSASTATLNFPTNSNSNQIQNFCITPNGNFADVEILLVPLAAARPGFNATYQLLFHNKGTNAANGSISLDFMGSKMGFVSASDAPTSQISNQIIWNYSGLLPLETRSISLVMNILPQSTNNVGDTLLFAASILNPNELTPADNISNLTQILVGAYDPNDKTCLEGKMVSPSKIGDYLHYLIRFQNTRNSAAENVVIVDSLDVSKFDIASIQLLEISHTAKVKVQNNSLQFHFEGIMLPDSFTNQAASHGYVLFKIKTKANLLANTTVENKAEIYFDYNLPVVTNTETTTFVSTTGMAFASQPIHFQCYPNPTQNFLVIETEKANDFEIINVLGENVANVFVQSKISVDLSAFPKGIYLIKEKNTGNGLRFVKE